MANMLMMRYAASRGENGSNDRTDSYERGMDSYGGNGMTYREPMQQPARDEYGSGAESRYRGKDGRWKAGRRSEYEGGSMNYDTENRRMGGDDEEEGRKYKIEVLPRNVIPWPYESRAEDVMEERTVGRQIGFGAQNTMGGMNTTKEIHNGMHDMHEYEGGESEGFSRYTAEKWVKGMEPEDRQQPRGGKWTPEMIRPIAQKYGISPESDRFWEFYAVMNAIYSDTSMIAREYGITTPDYYAKLAKAWLEDRDAVPNKAEMYYRYVVKHH